MDAGRRPGPKMLNAVARLALEAVLRGNLQIEIKCDPVRASADGSDCYHLL